jgi:hypothetical protein
VISTTHVCNVGDVVEIAKSVERQHKPSIFTISSLTSA